MIKWAKDLFPLCRSLTGKGTQKTLRYFKKINPEFKILAFKSGIKVFDWTIPNEWNITDAYIKHENGKKYCDFKKNNLHIVAYSTPVNKFLNKKELLKYIYTEKKQPNSIPYVTSYYKKRWGFCMTENEKKKLPSGKYNVFINSSLKKGVMELMDAKIKGKDKKEIFFSSYVCHPSMANNELSGPVLLNALMMYVKKAYPKTKYSYRFVLLPETIGSITYINKNLDNLKKNVICGFNLTCVGDERAYSYVSSKDGNTLADKAIKASLIGKKKVNAYNFTDRGSDERQYCSPKVNLPLVAFYKSRYYPEYHTNKDDFKLVTSKGLQESFEVIKNIIDVFENCLYPKTNFFCEPNMGKRNLYPTISKKFSYPDSKKFTYADLKTRMDIIAFGDGKTSLFEIAELINKPLKEVIEESKILKKNKIIS